MVAWGKKRVGVCGIEGGPMGRRGERRGGAERGK